MRTLYEQEIKTLRAHNCRADDWGGVSVAEDFSPEHIRDAEFSGDVTIGRDARIERIALRDIDIGHNVCIKSVHFAGQTGRSSFGNGSRIHCLAEDGARSVPLWRGLSSQWAHLLLHCKSTPAAEALEQLVRAETDALAANRSRIGNGCRLENCGTLRNIWLGDGTVVDGAAALTDVFADSSETAPVRIGEGVAAEDCVFQKASAISGGVRLAHCLAGEGARLANGFAAEHSLFFANADFALGEGLSVFAGPFSVSHHRATLVLACQTSFCNFGSGSNASNHHFRLGPRHGGVLRRGSRCGSGSYILWPSDIGAFTTVIGRHARSVDTADFPFSLLTAEGGESVLVPGVNLFTAGLFRDGRKWRDRDRRGGIAAPLDRYETAILSPYTLEAAERGLEILRRHRAEGGGDLRRNGVRIPAARVDAGIALYETAILYYAGRMALESGEAPAEDAAVEAMPEAFGMNGGSWRDWGGMLLSGARAEAFLRDAADGEFPTVAAVEERLRALHAAYAADARRWAAARRRAAGSPEAFAEKFRDAAERVFARQMKDAEKEFSAAAAYGFGVEDAPLPAFRRVRGDAADDPVVQAMREERERVLGIR